MEWKRRGTIAGIVIGVYAGFRYLLPVALPFLLAWVLATWLYPVVTRLEKRIKIKKTLAGSMILIAGICLVGVVVFWGLAELLEQIKTAVCNFPIFQRWCENMLNDGCVMLEKATGIEAADTRKFILKTVDEAKTQMVSALNPEAFSRMFSLMKGGVVLISGIVVTFISTILLLGDMENMRRRIWDHSWLTSVQRVVRRLKKTMITYLKAQIVIMVLVAIACTGGFWMMGSPYFLILGILLGVLDAIPLIGTGSILYPSAIVFLLRGETSVAIGCVLLDIVTSFLREFLEPRLLGEKLGISPITILVSVYAGVFLFGAGGVLLGPLAFSTIYEAGRECDVWG